MFDAGAIIFKIQAIGAEVFKRDLDGADQATKKLGQSQKDAAKSTEDLGKKQDDASKKTKSFAKELTGLSDKGKQAASTVGTSMLGIGAAVGAMAALTVSKFAEFDQAVSGTQAATHESAANMKLLSAAAVEAGAETAFSATEAANAQTELAKAGVATADILKGGLKGSLALAAAGQLGVADAASIAATTLTQFNLTGDKTEHVADLLAAGAGKAQGSVQDLGGALEYVGPVAANLGISVEETTGTLALFAKQGQIGMKAGTGLRGVLMSLTSPTKEASDVMAEYNIRMFDGQGKFIGMAGAAEQLNKAFADRTDAERSAALGAIFGNAQITAATVLYKAGAKGVDEWTDSVNDAGFAAETAAIMQNNLRGDLEKLGGSFDTAMIQTGAAANGVLRDMVQVLTSLVDWYGALPGPVQSTALAVGIGTAAVLLFGGTVLVAVPKIAAFRAALQVLSVEMPRTAGAMKGLTSFLFGPWGAALVAAGAAVTVLTHYLEGLQATSGEITNSLKTAKTAADIFATAAKGKDVSWWSDVKKDLQDLPAVLDAADDQANNLFARFDSSHFGAFDALKEIGKQLGALASTDLPSAQRAFSLLTKGQHLSEKQLGTLLDQMPDYKDALIEQATAQGIQVAGLSKAETAQKLLKLAREDTTEATKPATQAEQELAAATEAASKAQDEWAKMVADSDSSFVDLGGALDTIIQKNQDVAQKTADSTKSSKDSWQDYYDGFSFSLDKYLKELQTQVDAQTDWEKNMILLSGRASQGLIDELAKMGPEGAPLVAKLVTASDAELAKMEKLYGQRGGDSVGAFVDSLGGSSDIIKAASAQLGQKAADEIATKLANGTATVQQIIAQYGLQISALDPKVVVEVDGNTDPATRALNEWLSVNASHRIHMVLDAVDGSGRPAGGSGITKADGGKVNFYANGGAEHHIAQFARAGTMRVWAEPETEGEWYIPAAKSKRQRSTQVLAAAAAEFGFQLVPAGGQHFADGGRSGAGPAGNTTITMQFDVHGIPEADAETSARHIGNVVSEKVKEYIG